MADPQQVGPASGSTSSWGPGEIALDPNADKMTQLMDGLNQGGVVVTNGETKGFIHHSKLNQFLADNPTYEKGMVFSGPDGNLAGVVKASQAGQFHTENPTYQPGLPKQTAGWNPAATSRFASAKNFAQSIENDPDLQPDKPTVGNLAKTAVLGPLAGYRAVRGALRIPQDAAKEIGQYLQAEGESPRAAPIVHDVSSPVGQAASEFVGSQYEPKQLAMLGAFSALPRNTAALRTLHRAIGGYFAARGTKDAMQQADQAQAAFERGDAAEGMRQLTGAGFGAGFAVAGGKDVGTDLATNPRGVVADAAETLKAPRDWAAGQLQESAEQQMQRVLTRGGGTKKEKALAAKVAPEMLRRGVLAGSATGLEEQSAAKAEEAGQQLEDFYKNLPQGAHIPTQPLLDHFDQAKQEFISPDSGQVLDQNAIDKIDALKQVVQQFGPHVTVNDIVALRRIWDQQVAASRAGHVLPNIDESTGIDIKREAANAIRGELAKQFPDLDKINKEFSFWKNINTVMSATNLRKGGHAALSLQDLIFGATGAGGLFAHGGLGAGAEGAAAAVALSKAMKSTAWNTVSANAKSKIANMLADGNITGAAAQLPPSGPPPGPTGLPSSILNQPPTPPAPAQTTLPFGVGAASVPPVAGEAPAAPPDTFRPATGTPSQAPLFRKPWEVARPMGTEEAQRLGIARPEAQTPAPAEKVAPAAPETPQRTPYRAGLTTEQNAAIDEAQQHLAAGTKDGAVYNGIRERAYHPYLEPAELHGQSMETQRFGQNGKSTKEVEVDENGDYMPAADEHHWNQTRQVLGPESDVPQLKPGEKPKLILMGGGMSTGKSTALGPELKAEFQGVAKADNDVIKFGSKDEGFGGGKVDGLKYANVLKQSDPMGAAARLHQESSDVLKMVQKEAMRRQQSLILDAVGGDAEKVKQLIREFQTAGYDVEAHYVDRDLHEALQSMGGRFDKSGRWVPPDVAEEGHLGAANAYHQVAPYVSKSSLRVAVPSETGAPKYEVVHRGSNLEPGSAKGYTDHVENDVLYRKHLEKGELSGRDQLQRPGVDREGLEGTARGGQGGPPQAETPRREPGGMEAGGGGAGSPETISALAAKLTEKPLHIAEGAAPKDKPVTLVYGGGFNPTHEGHAAALQAAHDSLTEAGYNVDKIIVAPTADKLLAEKVSKADHLRVEGRARVAETAMPKEINGVPVEVSTASAQEAEAKPGKPRRADLAGWAERQKPGNTVINVAGDDAAAPGSPQYDGPKLYQGAAGTAHEGINYLELPRAEGISSTKIRNALGFGEDVPHMSPEAARVYREEFAKQQAPPAQGKGAGPAALPRSITNTPPPEPVSTARQNRQIAPGEPIPVVEGAHTSILMPDGSSIPAQYVWGEADHMKPSHNAMTFAKNPEFPEAEGAQERAYHSSKEAQMRVADQANPAKFKPGYIFNTNPDLVNGPPAITPEGKVPAGNSRMMTQQRMYAQGNGDLVRQPTIASAAQFGGDPAEVAKLRNPVLGRRVAAPASAEDLRSMMTAMNKPMTGALGASERAVSAGKALKQESLAEIGHMVDQTGDGASLREAMQKHGPDMLKILQRDGVITDRERPGMIDTSKGGLNEDGKNFVEKALIGSVVEDPDLMDRTPKSVLNKLGSSLGDVASLAGRSDEYNISSLIRAALREHVAAAERSGPLEDYLQQSKMFGPKTNPAVETLARSLDGPVKNFRAALRSFAQDARADVAGQETMLLAEKPSAVNAFNHAFGTNLSEREFKQALHDALKEERHVGKLEK